MLSIFENIKTILFKTNIIGIIFQGEIELETNFYDSSFVVRTRLMPDIKNTIPSTP